MRLDDKRYIKSRCKWSFFVDKFLILLRHTVGSVWQNQFDCTLYGSLQLIGACRSNQRVYPSSNNIIIAKSPENKFCILAKRARYAKINLIDISYSASPNGESYGEYELKFSICKTPTVVQKKCSCG